MSKKEKMARKKLRQENKRLSRRKTRTVVKMADEKSFKRELKGLTQIQQHKIKRARKKVQRKQLRKAKKKARLEQKNGSDENKKESSKDKALNPRLNGSPKKALKKKKKGKVEATPDASKGKQTNVEVDTKGHLKLFGRIKKARRTNKRKKRVKQIKLFVSIVGLPTIIASLAIGLVIAFVVSSGVIVSVMLSHPQAIRDMYKLGVLGNSLNMGNVLEDVFEDEDDEEGTVLVKGKDSAQVGDVVWNGSTISTNKNPNKGESSDGDTGGGGSTSEGVPEDKKAFLKMDIGNNFKINKDKMNADVLANSQKAKTRLRSIENINRVSGIVKANGMSPEIFWAYELEEQGDFWGWLNHTYRLKDTFHDADSVSKWAVGATQSTGSVQLAWFDMAFPFYKTPLAKQKEGQAFADALPKGALGRMYLSGTAAATWGAFDPNGLKYEYNKVQNYSDPIQGVMNRLNKWK